MYWCTNSAGYKIKTQEVKICMLFIWTRQNRVLIFGIIIAFNKATYGLTYNNKKMVDISECKWIASSLAEIEFRSVCIDYFLTSRTYICLLIVTSPAVRFNFVVGYFAFSFFCYIKIVWTLFSWICPAPAGLPALPPFYWALTIQHVSISVLHLLLGVNNSTCVYQCSSSSTGR